MRIAVDARAYNHPNGVGVYVTNILKGLLQADRENSYVVYSRAGADFPLDQARVEWRVTPGKSVLWKQFSVPRLAEKEGIDLFFFPAQSLPLPKLKAQTVVTVNDIGFLKYRSRSLLDTWRLRLMTGLIMRRAGAVIAISERSKNDLRETYGKAGASIRTIHLGYEQELFNPKQAASGRERVRAKYGIDHQYVIYLGGCKPHKNLAGLLKAARGFQGLKLLLVGPADHHSRELERLIFGMAAEGRGRRLGTVERQDLPGLIGGAACLVLPSFYEGFGLPVIEAMACGTPVACSSRGALPEVAGPAAEYFNPDQPDEILRAVHNITGSEKRKGELRAAGLERAKDFSWEQAAWSTLAVFRETGGLR